MFDVFCKNYKKCLTKKEKKKLASVIKGYLFVLVSVDTNGHSHLHMKLMKMYLYIYDNLNRDARTDHRSLEHINDI